MANDSRDDYRDDMIHEEDSDLIKNSMDAKVHVGVTDAQGSSDVVSEEEKKSIIETMDNEELKEAEEGVKADLSDDNPDDDVLVTSPEQATQIGEIESVDNPENEPAEPLFDEPLITVRGRETSETNETQTEEAPVEGPSDEGESVSEDEPVEEEETLDAGEAETEEAAVDTGEEAPVKEPSDEGESVSEDEPLEEEVLDAEETETEETAVDTGEEAPVEAPSDEGESVSEDELVEEEETLDAGEAEIEETAVDDGEGFEEETPENESLGKNKGNNGNKNKDKSNNGHGTQEDGVNENNPGKSKEDERLESESEQSEEETAVDDEVVYESENDEFESEIEDEIFEDSEDVVSNNGNKNQEKSNMGHGTQEDGVNENNPGYINNQEEIDEDIVAYESDDLEEIDIFDTFEDSGTNYSSDWTQEIENDVEEADFEMDDLFADNDEPDEFDIDDQDDEFEEAFEEEFEDIDSFDDVEDML